MKDRSRAELQMKSAETPMRIVENPRSPVVTRGQRDPYLSDVQRFPWTQFVDPIKS